MNETGEGKPSTRASIPFLTKLIRAIKLDSNLYEAIEHDPTALRHAVVAIVLINICSAIGALIYNMRLQETTIALDPLLTGMIVGEAVFLALARWLVLTGIIYLVGVRLFKGTAGFQEILRTIAFAYTPVALQILLPLFLMYEWVFLVLLGTNVWMIAALIIAVRQSLDLTTGKALGIVVFAGILYSIISVLPFAPLVY